MGSSCSRRRSVWRAVWIAMLVVPSLYLASPGIAATTFHVHTINFSFSPNVVTLAIGDTVNWDNHDGVTHTVTDRNCPRAGGPGPCEFDSVFTMTPGSQFNHTFTSDGIFNYMCTIHGFTGTLRVVPTEPTAPQSVTATRGPGPGEIRLNWLAPADNGDSTITAFRVHRSETSGAETFLTEVVGTTLTFTDTDLPPATRRFYKVSAVNAVGEGARSNEVNATTFGPPSAPRSLSASTGPAAGQITLNWLAPLDDGGQAVSNFRIFRGGTSGAETLLTEIGNVLTFTDSGLPDAAKRFYKVAAVNGLGEGSLSAEVEGTTPGAPSAPRSLTAARGPNVGEITLNWQAPTIEGATPIQKYRIYRSAVSQSEVFLAEIGNLLTFTDTGLSNNTRFFYKVGAVNSLGESVLSSETSALTPGPPTPPRSLVASTGPGGGQVSLSWIAPSDSGGTAIIGFRVFRGESSGSETFLTEVGNVLNFVDSGIPAGARRFYRLTAFNGAGESAFSNEVNMTAPNPPGAPATLTAARGPGAGQITLNWTAPINSGGTAVTNFRIHRGSSSNTETFLAEVGDVRTFTDSGLPNNVSRFYKVTAVNAAGEGPFSVERSASTANVPGPPANLRAIPGFAPGDIFLTWSAPASTGGLPLAGYFVYRQTEVDPAPVRIGQTTSLITSFSDVACPALALCRYTVTALNDAGESVRSNEALMVGWEPPSI